MWISTEGAYLWIRVLWLYFNMEIIVGVIEYGIIKYIRLYVVSALDITEFSIQIFLEIQAII